MGENDRFTFPSAGQVHELELAMDRVGGWNAALVKALCTGNNLGLIRDVLLGRAEVKMSKHLINCDADPFVPKGWSVVEHRKGGSFAWNPAAVEFYLSDPQRKRKVIEGNKLHTELAGKPVMNANVLDYLLAHPHLIPENWKKDENSDARYIFFWGTIYRDAYGDLYVRYLYFIDGQWRWYCYWLDYDWYDGSPAALCASN